MAVLKLAMGTSVFRIRTAVDFPPVLKSDHTMRSCRAASLQRRAGPSFCLRRVMRAPHNAEGHFPSLGKVAGWPPGYRPPMERVSAPANPCPLSRMLTPSSLRVAAECGSASGPHCFPRRPTPFAAPPLAFGILASSRPILISAAVHTYRCDRPCFNAGGGPVWNRASTLIIVWLPPKSRVSCFWRLLIFAVWPGRKPFGRAENPPIAFICELKKQVRRGLVLRGEGQSAISDRAGVAHGSQIPTQQNEPLRRLKEAGGATPGSSA